MTFIFPTDHSYPENLQLFEGQIVYQNIEKSGFPNVNISSDVYF